MNYDHLSFDDLDRPVLAELFRSVMPNDIDAAARASRKRVLEDLQGHLARPGVAERVARAEEMFAQTSCPDSWEATDIVVKLCLMAHLPEYATEIPDLTIGADFYNTVRTGELGQMRPAPEILLAEGGANRLTIRGELINLSCGPDDVDRIREAARRTASVIAERIHPVRQSLGEDIFPMPTRSGLNTDLDASMYPFDHGQMADRMGDCAAIDALLVEAETDREVRRILEAHDLPVSSWLEIAHAAGDGDALLGACRAAEIPQLSLGVRINDRLPGILQDPTAGWHEKPAAQEIWRKRLLEQVTAARAEPEAELESMTP